MQEYSLNILHNQYNDLTKYTSTIWDHLRDEWRLDEIKHIQDRAIDIAPDSMVEALALAIIGNLENLGRWHEDIESPEENILSDSWAIYNYLYNTYQYLYIYLYKHFN